jgi:20S proteasome alpha/beta subunit
MMAADRKVSLGMMNIYQEGYLKLHRITDRVMCGFSGSVSAGQSFLRLMQFQMKNYEIEQRQPLRGIGVANLASHCVRAIVGGSEHGIIDLIVSVYDPIQKKSQTFSVGPDGSIIESGIQVTGSGMIFAYPYLLSKVKSDDLSEQEARECVIESIRLSSAIDAGSGVGIDLAILDSQGVRFENEVYRIPSVERSI